MAITFDGPNKRIILDSTAHTVEEIWSRWVDWFVLNPQWPLAMRYIGGDVTDPATGKFAPRFFFVENDWGIRPIESNHDLTITGFVVKQGGGSPFVRTLGPYQVAIHYSVPAAAEGISTSGPPVPTAQQNAAAVGALMVDTDANLLQAINTIFGAFGRGGIYPIGDGTYEIRDANGDPLILGTIAGATRSVP